MKNWWKRMSDGDRMIFIGVVLAVLIFSALGIVNGCPQ